MREAGFLDDAVDLVDRIRAAGVPRVSVEPVEGPGWMRADQIALGLGLDEQLARVGAWARTESTQVAGALFLDAYAWSITGAVAAAILLDRSVPGLEPDRTHVRFGENGRAVAVSLAGDPPHRGDDSALIDAYRVELVGHLEPLLDRLHRLCRRGRAAFWRNAGDMTAYTLVWCGRALDSPVRGAELARRLLEVPSPLGPPRAFRLATRDGLQTLTCHRRGCCLWLRTPHAAVCAGCPVRRSRGWTG